MSTTYFEFASGDFAQSAGAIVVVDSADRARADEARELVENLLSDELLAGKPLLVMANKRDRPDCMTQDELIEVTNLRAYPPKRWYLQVSSVR